MLRQHYSNFADIAQEKSRAKIKQEDKIVRNRDNRYVGDLRILASTEL